MLRITGDETCGLSALQVVLPRKGQRDENLPGLWDSRLYLGSGSRELLIPVPRSSAGHFLVGFPQERCAASIDYSEQAIAGSPLVALSAPTTTFDEGKKFNGLHDPGGYQKVVNGFPKRILGYPERGGYTATGDDGALGRPASDVVASVLGTSGQGYMGIEIWRSDDFVELPGGTARSVKFKGRISRGSLVMGVASMSTETAPRASYTVVGSAFSAGHDDFAVCVPIPPKVGVSIFIGAISDLYSTSWLDGSLESISISEEACHPRLRAFLPTL